MLEFNRLPCSNNKMYDDADFADRFRYQLTMFEIPVFVWLSRLLHARICIWIRYCQNHRSIHPNFPLFAWFDRLEFNRLPCSINKMYDDAVLADRFLYQMTMFGIRVLIWLSRLIHARILIWNRYCPNHRSFLPNFLLFAWFDTVEFNRPSCLNNKIFDNAVFFDRFWY